MAAFPVPRLCHRPQHHALHPAPDPFEIYESAAARIMCTEQEPGAGGAQTQIRTWTTTDGRTGGRTDVDGREALWH